MTMYHARSCYDYITTLIVNRSELGSSGAHICFHSENPEFIYGYQGNAISPGMAEGQQAQCRTRFPA
jgi:hypothetical protein